MCFNAPLDLFSLINKGGEGEKSPRASITENLLTLPSQCYTSRIESVVLGLLQPALDVTLDLYVWLSHLPWGKSEDNGLDSCRMRGHTLVSNASHGPAGNSA